MRFYLLIALLLLFFLSACSSESPETAMREWLNASLQMEGLKLAERTCDRLIPAVQSAGAMNSAFFMAGQMFVGQELDQQADLTGLRFETVSNSGGSARVRMSGEIRVAIMATFQVVPVDYTADMLLEDNRWKWCGP